jgi:hypothetical protein
VPDPKVRAEQGGHKPTLFCFRNADHAPAVSPFSSRLIRISYLNLFRPPSSFAYLLFILECGIFVDKAAVHHL